MNTLTPDEFLKQLIATREAFWEQMNAERRSYGAEKPLSPAVVLRRLQFGVVMERKAAEVTAPWVGKIPDIDLQQPMSEYVTQLRELNVRFLGEVSGMPAEPNLEEKAPHPFFGPLNCKEWAAFQRVHDEDHVQHAQKILAAVGST